MLDDTEDRTNSMWSVTCCEERQTLLTLIYSLILPISIATTFCSVRPSSLSCHIICDACSLDDVSVGCVDTIRAMLSRWTCHIWIVDTHWRCRRTDASVRMLVTHKSRWQKNRDFWLIDREIRRHLNDESNSCRLYASFMRFLYAAHTSLWICYVISEYAAFTHQLHNGHWMLSACLLCDCHQMLPGISVYSICHLHQS